jgi:hypothetical protein
MPVRFAEDIELLNYTVAPSVVRPGSVIHVTFDWRCLAPMDTSYKLFVHVLGFDGERLTQLDTIPYQGRFATVLWQPGQEFRDEYDLFITGAARPSLGRIQLGFFPWDEPAERLTVSDAEGRFIGDHLDLAPFKIAPKDLQRPTIPQPLNVSFGEAISLAGYDLSPTPARAGESVTLTLYWEATAPIAEDYTVFEHILDAEGNIVAQADGPPQHGNYPTSIWGAGENIVDEHTVALPVGLAAGDYTVVVGLYRPESGQRLPVEMAGQPVPDGRAVIGLLEVASR